MNIIMINGDDYKWCLIVMRIDFVIIDSGGCGWTEDDISGWYTMVIEGGSNCGWNHGCDVGWT